MSERNIINYSGLCVSVSGLTTDLCDSAWRRQTACPPSPTWCLTACQSPCSAPDDGAEPLDWMFSAVSCSWSPRRPRIGGGRSWRIGAETARPRCRRRSLGPTSRPRRSCGTSWPCRRLGPHSDGTACRTSWTGCWRRRGTWASCKSPSAECSPDLLVILSWVRDILREW